MKSLLRITGFLLTMGAVMAGTSANYTLAPDTVDSGGLRGTSANYTVNASAMAGNAGASANYTARTGFAGQLEEPAGFYAVAISIIAIPATVNEGSTSQLSAKLHYSDNTTVPLVAGSVTWSVQSGPLTGISASGLAIAAAVYQDTRAVARGTYQSLTTIVNLTVLDILPDNYDEYGGDGIPDVWQVLYFGPHNPRGLPLEDPDTDGQNNLFEYNACLVPTDATSRFQFAFFPVPGHPEQRGLAFSPRFPDCSYSILTGNTPDAVSTPLIGGIVMDAGDKRRVIDPDADSSRKFYRVLITRP